MKSTKQEFQPVLDALEHIQQRLDVKFPALPIIGAASRREFLQQELPDHVQVISKKRQGPRVLVHRRHLHVASWPNDGMIEGRFPLLACVIAGEADFQIANYALCCKAGDWILFPPNVPRQDGRKPLFEGKTAGRYGEIFWLSLGEYRDRGLTCWVRRQEETFNIRPPHAHCRVDHHFLAHLFNGFCQEAFANNRRDITMHLLKVLLMMLHAEIVEGNALKDWGRPRYRSKSDQDSPVAEALTFIEEYLDQQLTIGKVAQQVFLSPSTFARLFKQETGQSFAEYQTQRRMKLAEELLKSSNRPILAIAHRVGLKSAQLRILFHQKHGCSPREYRNRKK